MKMKVGLLGLSGERCVKGDKGTVVGEEGAEDPGELVALAHELELSATRKAPLGLS